MKKNDIFSLANFYIFSFALTQYINILLYDRTYVCPGCGFTIDRDINAAINLREKMKQTLVGGVTAEFMRVDPHRLHEDLAINQVKAMAYEA